MTGPALSLLCSSAPLVSWHARQGRAQLAPRTPASPPPPVCCAARPPSCWRRAAATTSAWSSCSGRARPQTRPTEPASPRSALLPCLGMRQPARRCWLAVLPPARGTARTSARRCTLLPWAMQQPLHACCCSMAPRPGPSTLSRRATQRARGRRRMLASAACCGGGVLPLSRCVCAPTCVPACPPARLLQATPMDLAVEFDCTQVIQVSAATQQQCAAARCRPPSCAAAAALCRIADAWQPRRASGPLSPTRTCTDPVPQVFTTRG